MKNLNLVLVMIICCFVNKAVGMEKSHAQNVYASNIIFADGSWLSGVSNDSTNASPSYATVMSTQALYPYIRSVAGLTITPNNNVSRSLNSNYTISSSKNSFAVYSVTISVTLALTATTGTATLQYSTNSGSTWISLPKVAYSPLLAGVGLVTSQIVQINGFIPAGALVRINTTTASGVTYTYTDGQETLFN